MITAKSEHTSEDEEEEEGASRHVGLQPLTDRVNRRVKSKLINVLGKLI